MPRVKTAGFIKEKNNTWSIDTKVKIDGEWKHLKKKGFASLTEAKNSLETIKEQFIKDRSSHHKTMFFDELVDEYENTRKLIVNESTVESDYSTFRNYMLPMFGGRLLKDVLTGDTIHDWYRDLVENEEFTSNKKSKVITRMKDILKYAYMHKKIDAETFQDCDVNLIQVKYSKKPLTERIIWDYNEEESFLKTIQRNKKDSLLFRVFLSTSPRLGEFLALQPCCFDKDKRRITICQQVKNVKGKGSILSDKLKTQESYRSIAISQSLANELEKYIKDFNIQPNQYLWFNKNKNKPMSRNTIRRLFDKYCRLAGIRRMNIHSLRHNQAVKLASVCRTGEELEIAAKRLGHSPSMFMNTYANHINEKKEMELLERIGNA